MKKAVVRRKAVLDNNILCSLFNKVFLAHCANTRGVQREHNSIPTIACLQRVCPTISTTVPATKVDIAH